MTLQERMRAMVTRMVEAEDASLVDEFYDPDFRLTTNGSVQDLAEFRDGHERVYPTAITVARYRAGRLLRVWELTWPDWQRMDAFEEY